MGIEELTAWLKKKHYKLSEMDIKPLLTWEGPDGCLCTDRITVDGCGVGYLYREKPAHPGDSGWRFFEGSESKRYVNNPKYVEIYPLNTICNYDPEIIPLLTAPVGTAYGRNAQGKFVEEPFPFSEE